MTFVFFWKSKQKVRQITRKLLRKFFERSQNWREAANVLVGILLQTVQKSQKHRMKEQLSKLKSQKQTNLRYVNISDQHEHQVVNSDKNPSADSRPQFGNRFLTKEEDVFTHNAWDNVEWDAEQEAQALAAVQKNSTQKMTTEDQSRFENEADKFWDSFYDIHQNRFFKDRHWLFTEFPELAPEEGCNEPRQIFELGCGVGNTILPILKYSQEANLKVFGCDFSPKAIDIFRENPEFDEKRCNVFVMDATANDWNVPFEQGSLDIIVLIPALFCFDYEHGDSNIQPNRESRRAECSPISSDSEETGKIQLDWADVLLKSSYFAERWKETETRFET